MLNAGSQAARGTSVFLTQSIVSGIFRVLNIMILTRLLLQNQMGQIALLGVVYGFAQFLGALGLNHASPLVVPEAENTGRLDRVRGYLRRSVSLVLVTSLLLALALWVLSPIVISSGSLSSDLIWLAMIIMPFSSLEVFLDSFLLARYSVRHLAAGRLAFDGTRMAISVGMVMLGTGVNGVLLGWLTSEIVAVSIYGTASARGLPSKSTSIDITPILAFALPSLLFQTVDVAIQNADRLIVLQIVGLAPLGVYDVVLGVLFMMSFVSLTVSTSLYPVLTRIRVSAEVSQQPGEVMGKVAALLLRYIMILLMPVSAIVSLNSSAILTVLFGPAYANYPYAAISFSLLVVSYAFWGMVYSVHTVLRVMGEARFFLAVGLGVIVFEIPLCFYLTSFLGLLGAALTRSMYITVLLFTAFARLHQKGARGISILRRSFLKIALSAAIPGCLVRLIPMSGFLSFISWLVIAAFLYVVFLLVFREVNDLDFRLARSLLPTRMHGILDRFRRFYVKAK